jgi:hypothetical protein
MHVVLLLVLGAADRLRRVGGNCSAIAGSLAAKIPFLLIFAY